MIKLKTFLKILIAFSKRNLRFTIDLFIIFFCSLFNLLRFQKLFDNNIVFVSAADYKYFDNLIKLIDSFYKHLDNTLLIFDIGITEVQNNYLINNYKNLVIKKFDFNQYPKFIEKNFDGKLGSYAWKAIIVNQVLHQSMSKVVWLDAGNLITKRIILLKIALTTSGIVVPTSSNSINKWTHPKTIEYIGINNKNLNKNNYASGLVGFDYNSVKAKKVSDMWSKYSQIEDCIAPPGSSRENHRQDQAILTLLLYKYFFNAPLKKFFYPQTNFIFGVLFHERKIYQF